MDYITFGVTLLTSGALFGFIEFMIQRHDKRFNQLAAIQKSLTEIDDRIDNVEFMAAEREAKQWRSMILRFADECYMGLDHSQEHFLDMLDVISAYNDYCTSHPKFKNGKTTDASQRIKDTYHELIEQHKF